jgi:uncharacterized membrane protein
MELYLEHLEQGLSAFVQLLKFVLEAFAALVVFWGFLRTLNCAYKMGNRSEGGGNLSSQTP